MISIFQSNVAQKWKQNILIFNIPIITQPIQDSILEDKTSLIPEQEEKPRLRTKDLVVSETIILSVFFITILCVLFNPRDYLLSMLYTFLCPGLYTLLWRHRSIKYDNSDQQEDLQSGGSILFFIFSMFGCLLLIPFGFIGFLELLSREHFSINSMSHLIAFLTGSTYFFYAIKSFGRSIKIDAAKPSIKDRNLK